MVKWRKWAEEKPTLDSEFYLSKDAEGKGILQTHKDSKKLPMRWNYDPVSKILNDLTQNSSTDDLKYPEDYFWAYVKEVNLEEGQGST